MQNPAADATKEALRNCGQTRTFSSSWRTQGLWQCLALRLTQTTGDPGRTGCKKMQEKTGRARETPVTMLTQQHFSPS